MPYKKVKIQILIFLISLCAGLIFLLVFGQHRQINGDAPQYDAIAWNLVSGHGYSLDSEPPYNPTSLREPAYIIFLYFLYKLFGHNTQAVYVIQILLFSISCILVFLITMRIFNECAAKYAAFLTAICPTLADHATFLYSESFFIFLLLFSVYSVLRAKDTASIKWYVLSGLAMALMTLCKVAMVFFIIPAALYLYLNKKDIKITIVFIIFFIPLFSWGLRNYHIYGDFNLINTRGEQILLARAYRTECAFQKIKEMAVYNFSEYLGYKFFPYSDISSRDFQFQDDSRVRKEYQELINQGMSETDVNRIIRNKAFSILKGHPVKYLIGMPFDFFKLTLFMYVPSLNEENGINMFKHVRNGREVLSAVKGIYKALSFIILFFAIAGIAARKIQWQKEFMIFCVILYINLVYTVIGGYQRYAVPLIPFYFIFAVVGFTRIFKKGIC